MASFKTKMFMKESNVASMFSRFLASLPDGPPPPPVLRLKGLFKVVDILNPFDNNIGMFCFADPHHDECPSTFQNLANLVSDRKQALGDWASSVVEFLASKIKTDISVEDVVAVLVLPPHIKERLWRMMRMSKVSSADQRDDDSSSKVFGDKIEVYVEASSFRKDHFHIIVEGHQLYITGLAVSPVKGTKVMNKHIMVDASFLYDASKVCAVLKDGLLTVKFPTGTRN